MPEASSRKLSEIVPVLVACLVCNVAAADPGTGKKNLIGIFDQITAFNFPSERPLSVYVKFTDALGNYDLKIRYVEESSATVLAEAKGRMLVHNRRASIDACIPFPALPIPKAGRYLFEIYTNDVYLGSTFVEVAQKT